MALTAPELMKALLKKEGVRIKLLGDSITHGNGGTGFKQNGEPIVGNFKRNPDGKCWANDFAKYMNEKYGATVVNNACTGTKIQFVLNNIDTLVDDSDDLVICIIGTNNRSQNIADGPKRDRDEFYAEFLNNVKRLASELEKKVCRFILVANIPATDANEKDRADVWRILHMNDINNAYKEAKEECDFTFVSLYDLFSEYVKKGGTDGTELYRDGLHPNDEGYDVMLELIKKALEV